jgi:polysaccharide biosynthesis transport protein
MLQSRGSQFPEIHDPAPSARHAPERRRQEIPFGLGTLRRNIGLITACLIGAVLLGSAYLALRPSSYQAVSQLLIDHQVLQLTQQDVMYSTSSLNAATVQDQVAILRSQVISLRVVDNMNLADDPRFRQRAVGLKERLLDGISSALTWMGEGTGGGTQNIFMVMADGIALDQRGPPTADERRLAAVEAVRRNLSVRTVGGHTIEVGYSAPTPDEAAAVVNEIVAVYLQDQIESNARAAQSASAWLRERISELGTRARVISEAVPPTRPSGPGGMVVLAAAALAGLLAGAGGAWFREILDTNIRDPADAMSIVENRFFGSIPVHRLQSQIVSVPEELVAATAGERKITAYSSAFDWCVEFPLSRCAHTLQRALLAAESTHPTGSIGIVSTMPGEGRTVVAANLARLAASMGRRVLLIDAVPYKPDLSRDFGLGKEEGLIKALRTGKPLAELVWTDPGSGVHVLPMGGWPNALPDRHALWSREMEALLKEAQNSYDRIVVDLPPLSPVPDVRAAAEHLDALLLVLEWDSISSQRLESELAAAEVVQQKLVGVLFNKVRSGALLNIEPFRQRNKALRSYVDEGVMARNMKSSRSFGEMA